MKRPIKFLSMESYKNYFLAGFMDGVTKEVVYFKLDGENKRFALDDYSAIEYLLLKNYICTWEGWKYEIPVLGYAGDKLKSCNEINTLLRYVIPGSQPRDVQKQFDITFPDYLKHFQLSTVISSMVLNPQFFAARVHTGELIVPQQLPEVLSTSKQDEVKERVSIRLNQLRDIFTEIEDKIVLREGMSKMGIKDVMSSADSQIAEKYFRAKFDVKTYGDRRGSLNYDSFQYSFPGWVSFTTDRAKEFLELVRSERFYLDNDGNIVEPEKLSKFGNIVFGDLEVKLGIGGLHSNEKYFTAVEGDGFLLQECDVRSYYPELVSRLGVYPPVLGARFSAFYRSLIETRIQAKVRNDKVQAETLKIVLNATVGKFSNRYSCLYSPQNFAAVTLTGQLALLMLIEELFEKGFIILSVNTDGILTKYSREKIDEYAHICEAWKEKTGFVLEFNWVSKYFAKDVNNYVMRIAAPKFAESLTYETKQKGMFAPSSINKNPQAAIIPEALERYLIDHVPITNTIDTCEDIRKFIFMRAVRKGAIWGSSKIGSVARWIYSTEGAAICNVGNGNKIPKTANCRPIIRMPESLPHDLDKMRYVREAEAYMKKFRQSSYQMKLL